MDLRPYRSDGRGPILEGYPRCGPDRKDDQMRIIDSLRRPGVSIEADRTVRDAAKLMEQAGVGALAVLDQGAVVGIVTDRDLVRRVLAPALDPAGRVDGVMTMPVETIDGQSDLHDAARAFRAKGVRRLVVTDRDQFAGMVSVDDLILDLAGDLSDLAQPVTAETLFAHHDAPLPARP